MLPGNLFIAQCSLDSIIAHLGIPGRAILTYLLNIINKVYKSNLGTEPTLFLKIYHNMLLVLLINSCPKGLLL